MKLQISNIDIGVIFFYFILVLFVSWLAQRKKSEKASDYFLGGKDLSWFLVGASLFASNIGSEHLIGLAGSGASSGLAVAQFEILACFILLILGWFFAPYYLAGSITTMPEFLEKRYNKSCRSYLSIVSVLSYILTKVSVNIYAGATIFEVLGIPFWQGAFILVSVTGVYTILGGLRAVIYTDTLQMVVMIAGAALTTVLGVLKLGGITEIASSVPVDFLSLWRPSDHPDFPWTGIIFGAPILGIWYWCTDQFVVQRVLAAKNIKEARRGTLFAGFLKLLPMFIFVLPGVLCYVLAQKNMIPLEKSDHALISLIQYILPEGIRGIVIAGLFAALMSSLSSVFNSCSTLIVHDFFKKYSPQSSEKKLILVGQIATVVIVLLGMMWIPLMKTVSGNLFNYLQSIQAYISPPIASVFLFGILSKKINGKGAFLSLILGFLIGTGRLFLEINKSIVPESLNWFVQMNFLHFAFFLFVISTLVLFTSSYFFTESVSDHSTIKKVEDLQLDKTDYVLTGLLIFCVAGVWIIFS